MIEKVEGLVVRCIKYGESSLIFDLYTRQHGLVSCIIGGVRKSKSRTPAPLFQLMNWLELVLYFKEPSALNRVKECTLLYNYRQVPFDMRRRSIGLFMTEMVQKTVRERESPDVRLGHGGQAAETVGGIRRCEKTRPGTDHTFARSPRAEETLRRDMGRNPPRPVYGHADEGPVPRSGHA